MAMEKVWYTTKEMMQRGYSRRRLVEMFHKPGQRYARKKNPQKKTSAIEWNLPKLIEAEEKDMEMQAKARERRTGIA